MSKSPDSGMSRRALLKAAGAVLAAITIVARWPKEAWGYCRRSSVSPAAPATAGAHSGPRSPLPRLTEGTRRALFIAHEEARQLGERYVDTQHLLLGLIPQNDSTAARILDRLGVPLKRIWSDINRQVTRRHGRLEWDIQLTPGAKRVIHFAYEEACQLGAKHVGTEHLLVGLIREGDGLAARVLVKSGAELARVRKEIQETS